MYTSDLARAVVAAMVLLFADDTTLVVRAPSLVEALERMQAAVLQVGKYCQDNGLVGSPTKYQLLAVGTPEGVPVAIQVDGVPVNATDSIELLGVTVDRHLSGFQHAKKSAGKTSGAARMVVRLLRGLR